MRRKSRILLCFAVLWVLGIAYYFYSGTALSRKVGVPSSAALFLAARFVSVSVWMFSSRTKRRWSGVIWCCRACLRRLCFRGCTDAVRNVIKGLLVSVGRHRFGGDECGQEKRGWPVGVRRPPAVPVIAFPWQWERSTATPDSVLTTLTWRQCESRIKVKTCRVNVINIWLLAWFTGPVVVVVVVGVSL